ncbi:MAG TPA: toxin-antitoxin system TumE family protein [Candidatus Hypogeohydataceae bacterium YC38]
MKARLIRHDKVHDREGNIREIKIWRVKPAPDRSHGYKYSLVYIVQGRRVIGYDNAEGKGDHRHYGDRIGPYRFEDVDKLIEDFYSDIQKYKEEGL